MKNICTYLYPEFVSHIEKQSIKTIFECGSRDCLDAISMYNFYHPDIIYSFECNPESIEVCKRNIVGYPDIRLVESAVCDVNGLVDFYATDMEASTDKNIGASSLLRHRGDNMHGFVQKRTQVKAITLKTFMFLHHIKKIDLLCMDLQGAEYLAVIGLLQRSKDVHYVISEISYKSFYYDDMLKADFYYLMENLGFNKITSKGADALFVNKNFKNV